MRFDALIIGGGIAGMEASLNLADMGYRVLLVEREPTIGGKMVLLSKVFPTLDCSSCIVTPKMASVAHHPNITLYTYSQVLEVWKEKRGFRVKIRKRARYIKEELCTGCQECEIKCPVEVPDQYNFDLVGRKAVYIPFSIATPKKAVIDIDNCILCGVCERVCPADAIDFTQKDEELEVEVESIILATGFRLFDASRKELYGFGKYPNVINAMQMDRLLSPTRPYNAVLRPSDGKVPDNIAYVLCTGSRDRTVGNPLCSQICCMYSIKQAQLLMGALPLADITIYYIDIRAFGKGYEEFFQQAADMGVRFVKGRVAKIEEKENGNLLLYYEDIEGGGVKRVAEHDLVVLSVGLEPDFRAAEIFKNAELRFDEHGWVAQSHPLLFPVRTSIEGVFVAGTACGPMDIPDSILSAGAASAEAAAYIERNGGQR